MPASFTLSRRLIPARETGRPGGRRVGASAAETCTPSVQVEEIVWAVLCRLQPCGQGVIGELSVQGGQVLGILRAASGLDRDSRQGYER